MNRTENNCDNAKQPERGAAAKFIHKIAADKASGRDAYPFENSADQTLEQFNRIVMRGAFQVVQNGVPVK